MKRLLIILVIGLTFGLGFWFGQMKSFADGVVDDSKKDKLKSGTNGQLTENEEFHKFLYDFMHDSLFQFDRIKFPLKSFDIEKPDKKFKEKKDWNFTNLFADNEYKVQTYDNFEATLGDTDERMIVWEGVGNGINIQFKFRRTDQLWYLIEYNDYSD